MEKAHLLLLTAVLGSTAFAGTYAKRTTDDYESITIDRSLDASNSKRLTVRVPIGSVSVSTTRGREVKVHAVRSYRKPVTEVGQRWLKESVLKVERRGNELAIEDVPFGRKEGYDHRENFSPRLNIEVQIPEGMNVDLSVSAGELHGGGRYDSLVGHVAAGELSLKDVACEDDLKLSVGAGDLALRLSTGSNAEVSAKVGVGQINGMPGGRAAKGNEIKLGDERRARVGRGGSRIDLHVGVGEIRFGSADKAVGTHVEEREDKRPEKLRQEKESWDFDGDFTMPDMKQIHREVEAALREARSESRRAIEEARREIEQAMKEVDREFAREGARRGKREKLDESVEAAVRAALKAAREATDEALRSANKALDRASKN